MACRLAGDNPLSEPMLEIVNWTPGKKFQQNLNRNLHIFIQENPFENVVWEMSAILSPPQCVKTVSTFIQPSVSTTPTSASPIFLKFSRQIMPTCQAYILYNFNKGLKLNIPSVGV